jgi:hypothetical protein
MDVMDVKRDQLSKVQRSTVCLLDAVVKKGVRAWYDKMVEQAIVTSDVGKAKKKSTMPNPESTRGWISCMPGCGHRVPFPPKIKKGSAMLSWFPCW